MSTATNTVSTRRAWYRRGALAAVVLIPLAFAGLFVGAIGSGDKALDNIPVAIVNQDKLQNTTAPDGTEQPVFAGRQLVTELTGSSGFDWTITNEKDADAALKAGDVYAVLTVPSNFSSSILSLTSDKPQKADISIRTDDAHSYLTGSVAQVVGQTMTDTFGNAITAQYIGGIYSSLGSVGTSLTQAADGATQLASGATSLSSGLSQYTGGVSSLSSGAGSLASGVTQYTGGVDSLSSGLSDLATQTQGLGRLASGVQTYTGGVSYISGKLDAINDVNPLTPLGDPNVQALLSQLRTAAGGGPDLAAGASGLPALESGIAQAAGGASQLASGSDSLVSGADGLASGASQLAAGGAPLVDGTNSLASGATTLASGLTSGAASIPAADSDAAASSAKIAADPVGLTVSTDNPVSDVGQVVATFFVPLGLWLGALAVFLVLRPITRRALTSTARNGRLVASAIARAGLVTVAQAVLLVALLHGALGVPWHLLPATLGFSLLTALAFTAFHYLLTIGLGRAGLVVSLFLLAIQITSTGGIYPIQLLSQPFQVVSPFLPLTYAVQGMQGILSGGDPGAVVTSALVLLAFGVASTLLALVAIGRTRRATALGLVPRTT